MSKMNELSMILDNLIECGNQLVNTANAIKGFYASKKEIELQEQNTPEKNEEKKYTLEEVRALLSEKSKAGFREQVREMLHKRGVDNLTKLDPSEYPSLVKEVEGLTNG